MKISLPSDTVFYSIEKSIKEYRKFAQRKIAESFNDITIDQAMVLLYLNTYPELTQNEIADMILKDNASMTRMINLMVNNKYLKRSMNALDRRRYQLEITVKGTDTLNKLSTIIARNRKQTLEGISTKEIQQLEIVLQKIMANCK